MATSEVQICNEALALLGATSIISLTAPIENARRCNMFYASTRDELLRGHRWRFAINRATLARLADGPAYGYDYAFQLPTSPYCLRALETLEEKDDGTDWEVEGRTLVTDSDTCRLKYIAQITDPTQFDSLFKKTFIYTLAAKLAIPITKSRTLKELMVAEAGDALAEAELNNAIEAEREGNVSDEEGDWVTER